MRQKRTAFSRIVIGMLLGVALTGPNLSRSGHAAERVDHLFAFQPGERLIFSLKWAVIPAGEAVLEVRPRTIIPSDPFHFVLTARSNTFVDTFYVVRDRIDAWADKDLQRSILFRKDQHEGRTKRDVTVFFDWNAMTAQYQNHDNKRVPISITAGTFDPLSLFYWFRSVPLKVGDRIRRPITDGKKHVIGFADVIKKERIDVPAGSFEAFLVEPDLAHVSGVFEKSADARIQLWVSADQRRLPVKLKSKVAVGSFSGELVSVVNVAPALPLSGESER